MKRSNKDGVYNLFGISLAELCCTFDMHIINGRLFGDQDGNFTCIANNGASAVDLILLQVNFLLKYQIFRLKIAMRAFISPFIVSSHFYIKILHHILEINPRTDRHKIT